MAVQPEGSTAVSPGLEVGTSRSATVTGLCERRCIVGEVTICIWFTRPAPIDQLLCCPVCGKPLRIVRSAEEWAEVIGREYPFPSAVVPGPSVVSDASRLDPEDLLELLLEIGAAYIRGQIDAAEREIADAAVSAWLREEANRCRSDLSRTGAPSPTGNVSRVEPE